MNFDGSGGAVEVTAYSGMWTQVSFGAGGAIADGSVIRFVRRSIGSCTGAAALSASEHGGEVSGLLTSFQLDGAADYSDDGVYHMCLAVSPSTPSLLDSDFNYLDYVALTIHSVF